MTEVPPYLVFRGHAIPYDIIIEIATFASRTTLSRLMKTCRTLYHECAKLQLRRRVAIETRPDLTSFLAFLHAEEGTRCRCLRELVLDVDLPPLPEPGGLARSLIMAIQNYSFQSLTSMQLDNAENMLDSHPKLSIGLASLGTLAALIIRPAGMASLAFLKNLHSKLRTLVVTYERGFDQSHGGEEAFHPIVAFTKFRHSLETLEVHGYEAELSRTRFPGTYPRVRELILDSPDSPLLAPYIHAFPDVRKLSLTTVFADRLTPDSLSLEMSLIDAFRRTNQNDQTKFGSWTKLETVTGTAADLYLAGLKCAMETLYLNVCQWDPWSMVLPILLDASVSELHLFVAAFDPLGDGALPSILGRLAHSRIESLNLHIHLRAQEEWEDGQRTMVNHNSLDRLLQTVVPLNLRKFRITLRCECFTRGCGRHNSCGAHELRDFNTNTFAEHVLAVAPTVQEATVRFICSIKYSHNTYF
ncbi:hypothetical protein C8Q78DRAFT_628439 [Trametes maxima]|nr:hypothetical protein C8Q78DRAFT_628439 [Trametes maxima]